MTFHICKQPFKIERMEIRVLKQFFKATSAAQRKFRFKDFSDYKTESMTFVYPPNT